MATRYGFYAMKDGSTRLGQDYFNPVFKDVDTRLDKMENLRISWETAVQDLNAFGLERIDNVLSPVIQSTNEALANAEGLVAELEQIIEEADLEGDFAAQTASVIAQLDAHTTVIEEALQDALDVVDGALGGAVPSGAIIIWTGTACPSGWSRSTELDGLFLKGAATAQNPNLTPAGSNTHTHTIDHSHTLPSHTHTMSHTHTVPEHTHTVSITSSVTQGSITYGVDGTPLTAENRSNFRHSHPATASNTSLTSNGSSSANTGAWSGNTGVHSGGSSSSSNEPQHATVLFCKKD